MNDLPLIASGLVAVVLLLGSAFFSMSESSVFSLGRHQREKLQHEGRRSIVLIERLLREPYKIIITILLADEVFNIAYSSVIALMVRRVFTGLSPELLGLVSVLIAAPTLLIIGEIGPKTIGVKFPRLVSTVVAYPLTWMHFALAPVRLVIMVISVGITRLFGVRLGQEDSAERGPEEMEALVGLGGEQGVITETEIMLASRLFKLDGYKAHVIMTPVVECFFLPSTTSIGDARRLVKDKGFSRTPVYSDTRDNILGLLYAKDLLTRSVDCSRGIDTMLRPPYFIPRTKGAFELLTEFQQRRLHMAIVVDEYGRVDGVVTMEDILELLFGEFEDERRVESEPGFMREGESFMVSGGMRVEEFNDYLLFNVLRFGGIATLGEAINGSIIPQEGSDTIGGFVFNLFGAFPQVGDRVSYGSIEFTVTRVAGKRISKVKVARSGGEVADVA